MVPTVVVTLLLSLIGLIPAVRTSRRARVQGYPSRPAWLAFVLSLVANSAVIALVVVLVVSSGGTTTKPKPTPVAAGGATSSTGSRRDVASSVLQEVASVNLTPTTTALSGVSAPDPIQGPSLTQDGKPEIFAVGAEYCPFCAVESWPLVMALAKFGTFTTLKGTTSSGTDTSPNTPGFTFYKAKYTSQYISLVTLETETRTRQMLQKATAAEQSIINKYDYPPYVTGEGGSIPFILWGSGHLTSGSSYDGSSLSNLTLAQAASKLTATGSGASPVARQAQNSAALDVGIICKLINDAAPVCSGH